MQQHQQPFMTAQLSHPINLERRPPQPPERLFQRLQSPAYATLGASGHSLSGSGSIKPMIYGSQSPPYSAHHLFNTLNTMQKANGGSGKRRTRC